MRHNALREKRSLVLNIFRPLHLNTVTFSSFHWKLFYSQVLFFTHDKRGPQCVTINMANKTPEELTYLYPIFNFNVTLQSIPYVNNTVLAIQ